jgi:hydroxymethylpyrimidine pyrophosphatase-like HAD family hydrolase
MIADDVLRHVPGSALAADQGFREADIAIDYCEDVPSLPEAEVRRIVDRLHAHGLTVKVSSIHVNAWFGAYDKLGMTQRLLADEFGIPLDAQRACFGFVGDSPNDEPMFEFFACSAGVANIARFVDGLRSKPAYVTRAAEGAGFAELARLILAGRDAR